jgi:hypothetical protein
MEAIMKMQGAGGTPGGIGSFILGFLMMCIGFYLLMQSIIVTRTFGLGMGLFHFAFFGGPMTITSGMILIPLMFGIGMLFYNSGSVVGWALFIGSLAALVAGVLMNLEISIRTMTLFDLLTILVLFIGGIGLFLRSLRSHGRTEESGNEHLDA